MAPLIKQLSWVPGTSCALFDPVYFAAAPPAVLIPTLISNRGGHIRTQPLPIWMRFSLL